MDPEEWSIEGRGRGRAADLDGRPKVGWLGGHARIGKPVEINALWYNALRVMGNLRTVALGIRASGARACPTSKPGSKARDSFRERFWYEEGGYCKM